MKFIQGQNRTQTHIFPVSIDASIDPDNEVRLIDLFVDILQLKDYGFRVDFSENGRPAYHPSDILKLYIYENMYKVYSSRNLMQKESKEILMRYFIIPQKGLNLICINKLYEFLDELTLAASERKI